MKSLSLTLIGVLVLSSSSILPAMGPSPVRVLVWDEQQPEQKRGYDGGFLGEAIAAHLARQPGFTVKSVNLASPEQGLSPADLDATDVLVWWGHQRQREIKPERVDDVVERVKAGQLSLIAVHSAHWSQPFVRLMEERALADAEAKLSPTEFKALKTVHPPAFVAPKRDDPLTPLLEHTDAGGWRLNLPGCCFPAYRPDGALSHVKTLLPGHPLAKGLPASWDIPHTEMYDEPFHVPTPDTVVFEERWDRGEHFRSGCLWQIGKGRVFYFRPGHEIFPVFKQIENLRVIENAARWLTKPLPSSTGPLKKNGAAAPPARLALSGENFKVEGRPAFVFLPAESKRMNPQPWIFYAPTLPGLPDEAERWMHEQFLAAGVGVAGVDVGEAYGSPKSHAVFESLYRELKARHGFAAKPCLLGRSRGGLWVSSWAIANPDRVAGIAGIYPVFDLRTYPGLTNAAGAYGLAPAELEAHADEFNPILRVEGLAKATVPVVLIHGDADKVVPLKENSAEFVRRYQHAGAESLVKLIVLEGQGHNLFEGFFHSQELVDFAIARARAGAHP